MVNGPPMNCYINTTGPYVNTGPGVLVYQYVLVIYQSILQTKDCQKIIAFQPTHFLSITGDTLFISFFCPLYLAAAGLTDT